MGDRGCCAFHFKEARQGAIFVDRIHRRNRPCLRTGGKDYYLFPVYPTMFAVGAAACSELPEWLLGGWFALATMQTLILAPLVLPILNPPDLASYLASAASEASSG